MSKFLPFNLFVRQALLYPLTAPFLPAIANVKKGIKYAAGLLTGTYECPPAGGLPKTGQTTSYVADDDGDYQAGAPLTPPRFTDNGDGTITDHGTGLMWVKDPINEVGEPFNAVMNWANAIINCEALDYAEHDDWRLPNIKELMSIVDYERKSPAIDPTFFPNTEFAAAYWSSTTYKLATAVAWSVLFSLGSVGAITKTTTRWVRPVRLGVPT